MCFRKWNTFRFHNGCHIWFHWQMHIVIINVKRKTHFRNANVLTMQLAALYIFVRRLQYLIATELDIHNLYVRNSFGLNKNLRHSVILTWIFDVYVQCPMYNNQHLTIFIKHKIVWLRSETQIIIIIMKIFPF